MVSSCFFHLQLLLIAVFSARSLAIRCYYCTTHDIATCERMATIVTCPVGFNRCYYSYSMWKPLPSTSTPSLFSSSGVMTKSLAVKSSKLLPIFGGNSTTTFLNMNGTDGNDTDGSLMPQQTLLLAEEKLPMMSSEGGADELLSAVQMVEERPPEIIDRPNGEDWEKIAQGCARAGVFPCSGSEGRGTRPDQDYCFGDLSYGNCIGIQCNNPGVTQLIFGNKASTITFAENQFLLVIFSIISSLLM